jgi:hypothetical protein
MAMKCRRGTRASAITAVIAALCAAATTAHGQPNSWRRHQVDLRVVGGIRVRAPLAAQTLPQTPIAAAEQPIPIDGFVPYVAIALTDKSRPGEFAFAHVLANSVVGNPLNSPLSQNYAIGILDTGGTVNIIGHCDRDVLGLTNAWLTGNTVAIGGAGGQIDADVTQPLGMFVAGLQAIDPGTLDLDTTKLLGHWHVSAVVPPETACGDLVDIPSAVGTTLVAFRDVWIRNDHKRTIVRHEVTYAGPEVSVHVPGDAAVPDYPNVIALDVRPTLLASSMTTSAYFISLENLDDFRTPGIPTGLVDVEGDWPTGGWFVASTWLQEGTRPEINKLFMVDTGAQISLVRSFVAGQLGLNPNAPEFTVEVTGVTGDVTTAPGFYLDSLKIDTLSADQLQFAQVPIIILDLPSVEGGTLDGIIGTNVFFDRNLAFKPRLAGSSVLEVSAPIPAVLYYGDFDADNDVDLSDFLQFQSCFNGPNRPPAQSNCDDADADKDNDVDLGDFLVFQGCFNGSNRPPTPTCPAR